MNAVDAISTMKRRIPMGVGTVDGLLLRATATVELTDQGDGKKRMSFTGVVSRQSQGNGNWYEFGFGQCQDTIREILAGKKESEFTAKHRKVLELWDRWHLNDMRAGCEHQRERGWFMCPGYHKSKQETCRGDLGPNGLAEAQIVLGMPPGKMPKEFGYGDRQRWTCGLDAVSVPCPECGYKYGSKWLYEEVPQDVLDFLFPAKKDEG